MKVEIPDVVVEFFKSIPGVGESLSVERAMCEYMLGGFGNFVKFQLNKGDGKFLPFIVRKIEVTEEMRVIFGKEEANSEQSTTKN